MLDSKGQGKVLTKKYAQKRNKGIEDYRKVGNDYNWLDLEFPQGYGKDNPRTYQVRSRHYKKKIDIRERKGLGGD